MKPETYGAFTYREYYDWVVDEHPEWSRFVEVGCYKGCSTSHLAQRLRNSGRQFELFAVDLWEFTTDMESAWQGDFDSDRSPATLYERYCSNLLCNSVREFVWDIRGDSADSASRIEDSSVDFVFIDACHEYEAIYRDIVAWRPKVRHGGILSGHDYDVGTFRHQVVKAVDALIPERNLSAGNVWWVRIDDARPDAMP